MHHTTQRNKDVKKKRKSVYNEKELCHTSFMLGQSQNTKVALKSHQVATQSRTRSHMSQQCEPTSVEQGKPTPWSKFACSLMDWPNCDPSIATFTVFLLPLLTSRWDANANDQRSFECTRHGCFVPSINEVDSTVDNSSSQTMELYKKN